MQALHGGGSRYPGHALALLITALLDRLNAFASLNARNH
jgi:hypothetical protein